MIQIIIPRSSIDAAEKVILGKVDQLEYAVSPTAMTEISKAVFTITAKAFLRDLSAAAISQPKKYHHIYEWGQVGNPAGKLFTLKRATVQYGSLTIAIITNQSKVPVPIPKVLSSPGPTGKFVSTQSIFRNKMDIMEAGEPVTFTTDKTIAFSPDKENIVFVPSGTIVNIMHPGGYETKGSFTEFYESWYDIKAPMVVSQSNLMREIGNRVAFVVNQQHSSKSQVLSAIIDISSKYGGGVTQI